MKEAMKNPPRLEEVRREIDRIDDAMLALLEERFAVVAQVRAAKLAETGPKRAAFRPAREAQVLRRLLAAAGPHVPRGLLVRLWRSIMGSATQQQGALAVHASRALLADANAASLIGTQFDVITTHPDLATAMEAARAGGIAAVGLFEDFAPRLGALKGIGTLGVNRPAILLIGDASLAEPSGEDETLIACATPPAHALWASHGLAGISGFLEPGEIPAGCEFLGRYPRPPAVDEVSP